MDRTTIESRIRGLGYWYHNLNLHGVQTNPAMGDYPESRWRLLEPFIPQDISGKTVLDLACNSGFFSFKMKQRGAKHVLAIDVPRQIEQAKLVAEVYNADVEFRAQNVYEYMLTNTTQFDYVLFLGLFYHLRHPLLVLDRAAELTREKLLFQTQLYPPPTGAPFVPEKNYPLTQLPIFDRSDFPHMAFVENSVNGDRTNWWFPNESSVYGMLRSAGFSKIIPAISPAGDQCYICEPSVLPPRDDFYFWLSRCPAFPST
jgi:tRNA (mo5U34)-methyltransferase